MTAFPRCLECGTYFLHVERFMAHPCLNRSATPATVASSGRAALSAPGLPAVTAGGAA